MNAEKIIVFDIETLAQKQYYWELSDEWQESWEKRCEFYYSNEKEQLSEIPECSNNWYQGAWKKYSALCPEYSFILCIGVSLQTEADGEINSFVFGGEGIDLKTERKTILDFLKFVNKMYKSEDCIFKIGGYKIKQFDIPFVLKRALIHGINYDLFPPNLQLRNKKPWEMNNIIDVIDLWNFSSNIFRTHLEETCLALGVKSSKIGEVKGSDIFSYVYEKNNNNTEIFEYCKRDTIATLELIEKL